MEEPTWLKTFNELRPLIEQAADSCSENYRTKCFEVLSLRAVFGVSLFPAKGEAILSESKDLPRESARGASPRASTFMGQFQVRPEQVWSIIDQTSGEILIAKLATTGAEIQRRLAALLSLRNLLIGGDFSVSNESLVQACTRFGVYDASNFTKVMNRSVEDGVKVFQKEGDSWQVTRIGERFVARVVNEALREISGTSNRGSELASRTH